MNQGKKTVVEPIRSLKDIKSIKKILQGKPRDLAIFTLGINTNLRASDIIKIKIRQVVGTEGELVLNETKTGKPRRITLNRQVLDAIRRLLKTYGDYTMEDYLFQSRKKGGSLTPTSLSRLVKSWCEAINLKGNYASHSLRKTWGYHQRVTFNTGIAELMVCFNHSTQKQTLDYLCVQPEEIRSVYLNEL